MITEDLLYRKFQSADFVSFDKESKIIPVRMKNDYVKQDGFFDFEKKMWLPLSMCNMDCGYPEEFVEFPYPVKNYLKDKEDTTFYKDLGEEDFSADEISQFLKHRDYYHNRAKFNRRNFYDNNKIEKDFVKAKIITDTEKLTLKILFTKFIRNKNTSPHYETEIPRLGERFISFDMKNATVDLSSFSNIHASDKKDLYSKIESALSHEVIEKSYERLLELAEIFTGISFESYRKEMKTKSIGLYNFYKTTMLPFCPELFEIINSKQIKERKINFPYKRTDPEVFNHFCERYKIENTKTLRKIFLERPKGLLTFLRLKDAGFCDINFYNRIIESKKKSKIIDSADSKSFIFFCQYSIKTRGEKASLNTIFRKSENPRYDFFNLYDGLKMFKKYFKHIPDALKNDILIDGFTEFNHDALANIAYQHENKNIIFSYAAEEKNLEDEINGYSFRLPENSYQLCEIGNALHNCVASYADVIESNKCIIVYAQKNGEYKICIEIRKNIVVQERIDHNKGPDKEQRILLAKWRGRHNLRLSGCER